MTALRHSSIAITTGYYTDNKRRIALPMADYLNAQQPAPEKPFSKDAPAAGMDSDESAGKD